jgi:adenylate cyclase class 2
MRRRARLGADYKIRREIEFEIPDASAFRTMLGYLGFYPAFYYEKYRTNFRLRGVDGVLGSLDDTPIGTFIELEGRPGAIARARRLLGYAPENTILESYGALYARQQQARHEPFRHLLF